MKIENELIRQIKLGEEAKEPIDAASWNDEQGILLSRAEALELVKIIGQLKSLEAASYGLTLHSLFLLVRAGFEIHLRHSDTDNIKVIIRKDSTFAEGEIAKDAIHNGKFVDMFFTNLVASVK